MRIRSSVNNLVVVSQALSGSARSSNAGLSDTVLAREVLGYAGAGLEPPNR